MRRPDRAHGRRNKTEMSTGLGRYAALGAAALHAFAFAAAAADPGPRIVEGVPRADAHAALNLGREAYNKNSPGLLYAAFTPDLAITLPLDALREEFKAAWRADGHITGLRDRAAVRGDRLDGVRAHVDFAKGEAAAVTLLVDGDGRIAFLEVEDE